MGRGKLENPLVDNLNRAARKPLMTGLIIGALTISAGVGAILSGKSKNQEKTHQNAPKLNFCTPQQEKEVKVLLKQARTATREQAKAVMPKLNAILEKQLDCGWESVKDARADLSSRLQP